LLLLLLLLLLYHHCHADDVEEWIFGNNIKREKIG